MYKEQMSDLENKIYGDLKSWLPNAYLEKIDKATMAVGLEARVPLLDHRLVETASRIPTYYKIRGHRLKHIFKSAVKDLLPASVLRKRKHGFSVPLDPWFRGPLKDYIKEILSDPLTRSRGYFNQTYVNHLLSQHVNGHEDNANQLWLLTIFELWHRIYMDRQGLQTIR
jgi:asparagine synthase (glutamine-hydrolysing)